MTLAIASLVPFAWSALEFIPPRGGASPLKAYALGGACQTHRRGAKFFARIKMRAILAVGEWQRGGVYTGRIGRTQRGLPANDPAGGWVG